MKAKTHPANNLHAVLAITCFGLVSLATPLAHAANGTWLSTGSNQTWSDTANWVSGTVPGATSGVGNLDVATFNTAVGTVGTSGNPLTIDSGRNLRTISFDTNAGNYTIGTTGGNALNLTTASVIQISANATGSGIVQTINAPLLLNGGLTINNAAGNGTARFEIGGGISSATSGLKTLTLNSASANLLMNNVSGLIGDGAGQVAVIQGSGGGLWTLSNNANSFTGNLDVRAIMAVTSIGNSGVASAAGAGTTINLGTGTTTASLRYTGGSTTTNRTFNLNANTGASGIIVENAATVLTITSNITNTIAATSLTKALALSGSGSGVISGNILNSTGNGTGVTKTGSGTWTLSGNNTYSGPTIVNASGGTLVGIGANAFGTSSQYQLIGNATLSLRNDTSTTYAASLQFLATGGGTINVDQATSAGNGTKTFTLGAVTNPITQNTFAINFTGGNNTSLSLGAYTGHIGTAANASTHTLNNDIAGGGNLTIASYTDATLSTIGNTLIFAGSGNTTITGNVTQGTNPLFLTMNGTGTTRLNGSNSYAGITSVINGTLVLGGNNTNTGNIVVSGGNLVVSGSGTLGATTANLTMSGGVLDLGTTSQTVGALSITAPAASGNTIQNGNITATSYAASYSSGNAIVTANLLANGSAGVTKTGAGTLTLAGTNTYTGNTSLSGGILVAANTQAFGASAAPLRLTSGALDLATDTSITAYNTTVLGTTTIVSNKATASSAGITHTLGTLSIGAFTLNAAAGANVTGGSAGIAFGATTFTGNSFLNATTADLSLGAMDGGAAARVITKQGAGTLVLNGPGSFLINSGITITGGTVRQDVADALGSSSLFNVLINGATAGSTVAYNLNNVNQSILALTLNQGGSATANTMNNVDTGTGLLTLGSSVNYFKATLDANDAGTSTISGRLSVGAATRTFTIADSTNTANELNVTAAISSNGTFGITKAGSGTMTVSGSNTYTGATTITSGALVVGSNAPSGANGALGNATSEVVLGAAGGSLDASLLVGGAFTVGRNIRTPTDNTTDAGTRVLTLGGNTAANSVFSGNVILGTGSQAGRGVTLTAASGGQVTFSGVIQNPTSMDATSYTVTKSGAGTVVLSGNNTYTGNTSVTVGTLLVSNTAGSATGFGSVSVASGATLGGTGAIVMTGTNGVSVSGILAPGNTSSMGNFTIFLGSTTGNVTMLSNSTFAFDITGGTPNLSDRINLLGTAANGDFVFNSNVINFTLSGGLVVNQSYILIDGTDDIQYSGLTFSGNEITGGLTFSGLTGGFQTGSTLTLVNGDIIFTAIPEPSTWMLIALGLTFVVVMRRRATARG